MKSFEQFLNESLGSQLSVLLSDLYELIPEDAVGAIDVDEFETIVIDAKNAIGGSVENKVGITGTGYDFTKYYIIYSNMTDEGEIDGFVQCLVDIFSTLNDEYNGDTTLFKLPKLNKTEELIRRNIIED